MGWVTVNFLTNFFTSRQQQESYGALDWGGASSQITHQVLSNSRGHRLFSPHLIQTNKAVVNLFKLQ
jgi:hypothetical protein